MERISKICICNLARSLTVSSVKISMSDILMMSFGRSSMNVKNWVIQEGIPLELLH